MRLFLISASWVSGVGFLFYGFQCLFSSFMRLEFERFGQGRFRVLTGVLEILGGIGVLAGLMLTPLGIFASAGLCILMAMGVAVRIRIGDRFIEWSPALFFCLLNGGIIFLHLKG